MEALLNTSDLLFHANPHLYDYIHTIKLCSNGTFKLSDGGGQQINLYYNGVYEYSNNTILFQFKNKQNPYTKIKQELNTEILVNYELIPEDVEHFNGYSLLKSQYTLKIDKSPFILPNTDGISERKNNIFNIMENNSYPQVFYTNMIPVKNYDIAYYRAKENYSYFVNILLKDSKIPVLFSNLYKNKDNKVNLTMLQAYCNKLKSINILKLLDSVILYNNGTDFMFSMYNNTIVCIVNTSVFVYSYDIYTCSITLDEYNILSDINKINEILFDNKYTLSNFISCVLQPIN